MFIIIAENIKETAYEVNYILEKISGEETEEELNGELDSFVLYLYSTISKELREITIKAMKCIREIGNSKKLETLSKKEAYSPEDPSNSLFI